MLGSGSDDVSFCDVVLNMTLRRGNPGRWLRGGRRAIGS